MNLTISTVRDSIDDNCADPVQDFNDIPIQNMIVHEIYLDFTYLTLNLPEI
jgi:hypothetical protein